MSATPEAVLKLNRPTEGRCRLDRVLWGDGRAFCGVGAPRNLESGAHRLGRFGAAWGVVAVICVVMMYLWGLVSAGMAGANFPSLYCCSKLPKLPFWPRWVLGLTVFVICI